MSTTCEHTNPLKREGTTQVQRLLDALVPENVKLHELKAEDWLKFAKNYATQINFYNDTDAQNPADDWEDFFVAEDEVGNFLQTINSGNTGPHLSLFVAFLNLLEYPQKSINGIPKRHLDFYYREILRLSPKEFTPDSVHVLFELAKNANSEMVAKGSNFEAGKDGEGNLLNYELDKDIVVNQTKVSQIKSLFLNDNATLKYASQSNTVDGLEEALEDDLTWSAFGDEAWPDLPVELALSSDVLLLKKGKRTVTVVWDTNKDIPIEKDVKVVITGEEGWLDPLAVETNVNESNNKTWSFIIPEDGDPVGKYAEEFHQRRLNTTKPTMIFLFEDPSRYGPFQDIKIKTATVKVEVEGLKNIAIQNELGNQTADKPFMPFGPRPKKNTILTIDVEEFVNKHITGYDINMPYLNMPANFSTHYSAYSSSITNQKKEVNNNLGHIIGHLPNYVFEATYLSFGPSNIINSPGTLPDTMRSEFKVLVSSPYHAGASSHEMFNEPKITKNEAQLYTKGGQIEIQLLSSFYHDLYNPIYVKNIMKPVEGTDGLVILPNEPYTPLTSGISINYRAESKIVFDDANTASVKDVELHHITPFGSELIELKSTSLIPKISQNTLFVGLNGAQPNDVVSLLFQIAEGSEDPDESTFAPNEEIKWSVLDEVGKWKSLDDKYILSNATNNFLTSGIVEINLPKETGLDHFILDSDLVWLKLTLGKTPVSVSRFYNIHAQASVASFINKENTLEHLNSGLNPGSIAQLAQRKSRIKSVGQPYTSFGGKSTESDDNFYRRISERLRHKDRALTIWDYERLILQDFPQLHKVKCLNHTKKDADSVDELAPGNVTIVVIPKIKDSGSEYRLKPKVSQNTKDVIKAYLLSKKPMQVELDVVNPIYEEVDFAFNVRFYEGYDFNFHKAKIKEDLKAYISPWIKDEELNLSFGRSIYKYEVINFLENLEYVDYLENFFMYHKPYNEGREEKSEIFPSNSLAVLVAATEHAIDKTENC